MRAGSIPPPRESPSPPPFESQAGPCRPLRVARRCTRFGPAVPRCEHQRGDVALTMHPDLWMAIGLGDRRTLGPGQQNDASDLRRQLSRRESHLQWVGDITGRRQQAKQEQPAAPISSSGRAMRSRPNARKAVPRMMHSTSNWDGLARTRATSGMTSRSRPRRFRRKTSDKLCLRFKVKGLSSYG